MAEVMIGYRLTVQWAADANVFPRCSMLVGNFGPRRDGNFLSHWYAPADGITSDMIAGYLDKAREGLPFYSGDQLRALASQIRAATEKFELQGARPRNPWNQDYDPFGDDSMIFFGEYKGKIEPSALLLWVTPLKAIKL